MGVFHGQACGLPPPHKGLIAPAKTSPSRKFDIPLDLLDTETGGFSAADLCFAMFFFRRQNISLTPTYATYSHFLPQEGNRHYSQMTVIIPSSPPKCSTGILVS